MKLRSSNLANGSSMAGFTQGLNIFSEGGGLGHVTLFKILNPFSISGINEATLFKFGKWIDYSKSHGKGEKFHLKEAWSGSRDHF